MFSKQEISRLLRDQLPYLKSEYGVKAIAIFGSIQADTASEESDIDLVVEFSHPIGFRFIELAEYLENLLETSADILTPAGIDGIRIPAIASSIRGNLEYV